MTDTAFKKVPRTQNPNITKRVSIRTSNNRDRLIRQRRSHLGEEQEKNIDVGEDVVNPTLKMNRLARQALSKQPISKVKLFTKPVRRVWASSITTTILAWYFIPYVFVLACGVGYAVIQVLLAGSTFETVIPIETFKLLFWIGGMCVALISLMIAFAQFFITPKVAVNHSLVWVTLAVCLAGSIVPYMFFIPWVLVFCTAIIISQK